MIINHLICSNQVWNFGRQEFRLQSQRNLTLQVATTIKALIDRLEEKGNLGSWLYGFLIRGRINVSASS